MTFRRPLCPGAGRTLSRNGESVSYTHLDVYKRQVLRGIPREVVIQTEHRELTSWFAVFAAGLVIGALTLAVRWNPAA